MAGLKTALYWKPDYCMMTSYVKGTRMLVKKKKNYHTLLVNYKSWRHFITRTVSSPKACQSRGDPLRRFHWIHHHMVAQAREQGMLRDRTFGWIVGAGVIWRTQLLRVYLLKLEVIGWVAWGSGRCLCTVSSALLLVWISSSMLVRWYFLHPEQALSGVISATGAYSCDRLIANPGSLSGIICLLTEGQAAVSKQGTLSRPSRTSTDGKLYLQLD